MLDSQGVVVEWNHACEEILGLSSESVLGREIWDVLYSVLPRQTREGTDSEAVKATVLALLRAETPYGQDLNERMIERTDGQIRYVQESYFRINTSKGPMAGSIFRDITERKIAEQQAREREEQLVQADKMVSLGILVAGVAHEINNPNFMIMAGSSSLERFWAGILPALDTYCREHGTFSVEALDYAEVRKYVPDMLAAIHKSSERIRGIVQELRDFAQYSPADLVDDVAINVVVESAVTLLVDMLRKATHHLNIDYTESLPYIQGNHRRLEQVVVNLLQNACQALPSKDKAIYVRTRLAQNPTAVIVEVEDEGGGIREEDLPHVMDPFFTTRRTQGGAGLGLSISSTIVREHGGKLTLDSNIGRGTRTTVWLPVDRANLSPPKG